ncbi:MAG: sigma-70 family RNA polymerase sigma factor, partial [Limnobacter sp.]|nr:sigma-70 family RNA polymerase sigma factor [Limnobacter sp.]
LDDSHFEQPSDFNEQPMQQLLRKQEINQLKNAIERLPSRMQSVVSAVLLEGLSYQEAAEELNLPIGTVRSRLSRARDMLRDLMGIH